MFFILAVETSTSCFEFFASQLCLTNRVRVDWVSVSHIAEPDLILLFGYPCVSGLLLVVEVDYSCIQTFSIPFVVLHDVDRSFYAFLFIFHV
jgi:hypothetical protein